ncbi:hypothetical protein RRG08_049436 [Elysia crispata]|uniref:Uncharacterized protein n=1 Tax=Elysia crispata TaxID=231223 RepID=A0AAE0ZRY6_9GAST|nr:hypothetical protein RRG08_049436 [Elysia crispata]
MIFSFYGQCLRYEARSQFWLSVKRRNEWSVSTWVEGQRGPEGDNLDHRRLFPSSTQNEVTRVLSSSTNTHFRPNFANTYIHGTSGFATAPEVTPWRPSQNGWDSSRGDNRGPT